MMLKAQIRFESTSVVEWCVRTGFPLLRGEIQTFSGYPETCPLDRNQYKNCIHPGSDHAEFPDYMEMWMHTLTQAVLSTDAMPDACSEEKAPFQENENFLRIEDRVQESNG